MRHAAHVAHHLPGRLRIRVPSAKGDPAALEEIRSCLANVSGVKDVEFNPTTGSVTIHYDPVHHADFTRYLAGEGPHKEVIAVAEAPKLEDLSHVDSMIEHEAEFLTQHSNFAKAIFDGVNAMDRSLKRATNNNVDFKVLAPLVLAVGAFAELGVTASTPVWLTLGLFSFNHFVDLHTHPNANGAAPAKENARPRPRKRRVS